MLFVYRLTAGQEKVVADVLYNKIQKEKIPIYALAVIDELRGYIMLEADDEIAVRQAAMRIPHIKGVLRKTMGTQEIDALIEAKQAPPAFHKGDVVELVAGPFKGEKAKIIKIDESKEEVTVELTEVAVPIPVTIKMNTIRLYRKAEE
ncbi:MAG: transcription elongation factor Spt5 [Candidatus Micrarchaeia archaeon]